MVPLSNWLGDRIGATLARRLSMIGFALASALCGLAWNLDSMIVFRVKQAADQGPRITSSGNAVRSIQDQTGLRCHSARGAAGRGGRVPQAPTQTVLRLQNSRMPCADSSRP